jgi:hypothetical protein
MRFKDFYRNIPYKSQIITGITAFLLGAALFSQCSKPSKPEKTEPPSLYPGFFQVYRIEGYNDDKPVARAIMSDKRIELLSSDDKEGTIYTNLRILEERDILSKKSEWILKHSDLESKIQGDELRKIRETEEKKKKETEKKGK